MSPWVLYAAAGLSIVAIGLLGAFDGRAQGVRRILAINVMASGVFLVLIATARRGSAPDPVPHALVLTGIVVAVSATGVALALARRLAEGRDARQSGGVTDRSRP
jgi:multicomponent Na+:H+ antiporter subunit C